MNTIEFVSYDGEYPNLCSGTLVVKVNGNEHVLDRVLVSRGWCTWEDEHIEHAPWDINLSDYPELMLYENEILECVNSNVPYGCCGGCI